MNRQFSGQRLARCVRLVTVAGLGTVTSLASSVSSVALSQGASSQKPLSTANRSATADKNKQPRNPTSDRTKQSESAARRGTLLRRTLEDWFVPPRGDAPKSTANSATRADSSCRPGESAIAAWGPPSGYGLSTSDRPSITLDLPATSAKQVALLLRNNAGALLQQVFLPIAMEAVAEATAEVMAETTALAVQAEASDARSARSPNLVQFQLPVSDSGLLPGQPYHWSLVVVCGDFIEPDDPTFMGWVEYRAPTPEEADVLSGLSAQERLHWYGQRGYWYDMVQQ